MSDDGRRPPGTDPGDGSPGGGPEELPPELRALDRELERIRFRPRAGLEEEVADRIARARRRGERPAPGRRAAGWQVAAVVAAALLAAVAGPGLLDRPGGGGGPAETPESGPAAAVAPGGPASWAMRWGPDARVLAVGASASPGPRAEGRGLACVRAGGRLRCRGGELEADAAGEPAVLRDFCCLDYDGGGPGDDGVRVMAGRREAVVDFWIYEDRDATRSFSAGDVLRSVVPAVPSAGSGVRGRGGVRRLDRCCADLDGGPRADDGVFVVAGGRERVALAVLYEDETGDGRLGPGDRLRAVRAGRGGGPR